MKKNRKNSTKSLLACAVLASVLGGGMVPVQAASVNAVVAPKDFSTLNGKSIAFGQQLGYVAYWNRRVTYRTGTPTWQIVSDANGNLTLLACDDWGYNRYSDKNGYSELASPNATIQQLYYREVLKYLNEDVATLFTSEELSVLQEQISIEMWWQRSKSGTVGEYSGIFALPTTGQVNALGAEKRKRGGTYWLAECAFKCGVESDKRSFDYHTLWLSVNTVQTDGSIVQQPGQVEQYFYPTIAFRPITFVYYNEKLQSDTFKSQNVTEPSAISSKNLTFKDTDREKNVNITKLSVTQEGIAFDAAGLATGEGQGIGGLVEDADGNYLAYARLANGTDGTAQGKIKFNSSITGSNTIHLFNEWIGTSYDLLGNYYEMYVNTENAKISAFTNKWDVTYDELTIGKGVNYTAEGSSNVTAKKKFIWENSNGEKLVNITNVDNGYIHLGGAFSVENPDNATATNRTLKLTKTADVWNDIELYGINGGVMAMNVDLNSLYMDGGTFIIQGNLKATDYLQLYNGAELTIGGTVEAKRLEVNGALNLVDGAVTDETHLCNDSTLNLTGSDKTLNLQKSLTTDDGAKITGIDSTDKVEIFENLTAKGNITLDKITLEVENNIQIQGNLNGDAVISAEKIDVNGNLNGDAVISAEKIDVNGNIYANSLIVKNFFDLANGNAQSGTIGTLTFGEGGASAVYAFEVGKDKFTITNFASGKVKLVPKYGTALNGVETIVLFDGSGIFNNLILSDARVTDMTNKQTYLLTQNTSNKGQLKVTVGKHNAAVNFGDVATRGQRVYLGNCYQDNNTAKQPILWDVIKKDGDVLTLFSEKVLAKGGARLDRMINTVPIESFKENFDVNHAKGAWMKEAFTPGELELFGGVLYAPNWDDVKENGNFGLTAEQRKAVRTVYVGKNEYGITNSYSSGAAWWLHQVDMNGNMIMPGSETIGIRPAMNLDGGMLAGVLFATNAEGGKGSTGKGQITLLKKVESNSTLELTLDDAYIAQKSTGMRLTGDIQLTQLDLCGDALTVHYRNGVWFDRKNSYLSYFVGEGDAAADYFAYGKAGGIALGGSGISGKIKLDSVKDAAVNDRGMALTFFNEYGNGTSWAGSFAELPGSFTFGTDGNLVYTADIADIPSIGLVIGENNILKVMGSSYAGTVSITTITGKGTIQVAGDFTFSGDNHSFQGVLEVLDDHTLTLTGNDLYYSIIGNIKLQQDTTYRGTKLAGTVSSATGTKTLKLSNDLQIGADLSIENLDAQGKTLDMRDMEGTTNYDTLTIGKLWSNANLAIDVGMANPTDTEFTSDKIVLNGVESGSGAKITLNAINLIDDPQLETAGVIKTITGVVKDNVGSSVVVADGLEAYASYYKYTVSLDGDGNLTLAYDGMNPDGFKTFVKNTKTASYSFVGDTTLDGPVTTGSEGSATNITKTVFLNGHTLNSHTSSTPPDPLPNGITVADTHTLTMVGGTISGFATALTVNKTDATNFGTLNLKDVTFSGNTTDVANAGTMNIHGSVTMQKLTGDGTTEIQSGAELNLGDATATAPQTFEQTFKGDGTLNFKGNTTIAVTKLGISTDNLAVTIAENKILSLTGSGTDLLIKNIGGAGKINIANGNTITTDTVNLQVAEVANAGTLKIQPTTENANKINSLKTNIMGGGSLLLNGFNEAHGTITQSTVTIVQDSTLDAYDTVTANITNYGAAFFFVKDLQGDVTNFLPASGSETFLAPDGSTLLNGLVALYTDTDNRTLQKKITDGYIGIMGEVISDLNNLAGEVYIAAGHTLTLQGGASGSAANITQTIQGAESKMTGYGNGNLVTDGYFTADLDKVQVPLENKGKMTLTDGSTYHNMEKMTSITNSGNLAIGADITLDGNISNSGAMNINGCTFSGEMTNSGTSAKVTFDSTSTISGQIENSGTVEIKTGNTFETATAKVTGGKLILDGNYTFSNANIQGLTELYVNGATYNFNAELGATPSVELIDAEKVTGPTLNLGTVTATSNETLSEWELGETKIAPYLKDNIGNTVAVGNTAVVFSGDNYRFTFSQAKDDGGTPIIGSLAIIKENGGELWQIVRNTEVSGYPCGNVATYSLTGDYTEQMKGATTDTNKLGTLTPVSPATSRTLTIEGNGHFFAGNGKNGITVGNADDVLNFNNISEIKNWSSYIVTNNDGTVNFNNVTKLSSPVINTSGTVNFNGTTEVNSTLSGNGTFNNNGELTVTNTGYLEIDELTNNGIIKINGGVLSTKITGGILKIAGPTLVAVAGVAEGAAKLDVREIDIEPDSELLITGHTSTLGEMWIDNAGTLKLDIDINKAFICGGKVVIEKDGAHGPFITTQSILADEIILGDSGDIDPDTLNVTGDTDDTVLAFGKISGIHDNVKLNITKGKVYALDEVNGKIILGENVSLDIDADNIKKNVEIGTNANLNLGDGTLKTTTITGTNNGTVNFLGKVAVETGTSIPKATFKNGSTLVLDAKTDTAPLTITTEINIDSGAKLYVNGAEKNGTYKIVSVPPIDSAFEGWTLSNIRGRDAEGKHLVKAESFSVDSNVYSIVFKTAVPENTDLGKILENADGTPLADWAEKVCDAFDTAYGDAGEAYTANAINSMASASVLAGAQKGAATMVTQVAGNISANVGVGARSILGNRNQDAGLRGVSADVKLASPLEGKRADKGAWSGEGVDETAINTVEVGKASEVMPTEYKDKVYDKQVWASYIHSKQKIDGLKTGSLTQNSTIQLNGVTVGADLWSGKKFFGGLAITYADGNANSAQMSNSTKNEAKYYGISMYHRQDMGKYALTTDIGYTYNKNDITQHTTGITDEVTSKPKTHAYTVGMKLEREIYLSKACKIVPFAGARYTRLQNRDFSNSLGANTKVDNQNLVTVPVGLSFHSHLITTEGWKLGSILEGGYEWNFGNRHSTQEFGYGGAYNSIGFDVVDRGQYFVKAALTADYQNMFFELGYRYSKGKSVRDNKWNFNANFIF